MEQPFAAAAARFSRHRSDETARAVSAILEQVPGLTKIKQVRHRDGRLEEFAPGKIGQSLSDALKAVGVGDEALLARLTYQILGRLEREFGGCDAPATADVERVMVTVLIDNNLAYAAKKVLQAQAPAGGRSVCKAAPGLRFRRLFTTEGVHPFDEIEWETRDAVIVDSKGKTVFEQRGVEVPASWSQGATNIVVSKYFRGEIGKDDRESSVRQMVGRVAKTIADWGRQDGCFASETDAGVFEDELTHLLANQKAAFNSPVWFNVGIDPRPQCSACFINSVRDDMRSILNLAVTEGMLFKYGSGTGSNLSPLRSSRERLHRSNGRSSGPVSFMKGFDSFAGVIKSGGKTRRAAKMVILNADHPDIREFITCKQKEEKKARILIDNGYDGSMDGEAYSSVAFQNANNSVRATDEFMRAAAEGGEWQTRAVTTGEVVETMPASDLLREMAAAAWECGDPGMQFDTTVNRWNTVPNSGRINASNPCSEYMFLDDSSCNLASLNLMKFRDPDGEFDVPAFRHAVEIMIAAQDILVDNSSYPTPAIEQNSRDFRPLGLGYANLGALLMSRGLAYDSDEGRNYAAAVTALMSGRAYLQSSKLAEAMGSFEYYRLNERPFLRIIGMHRDRVRDIPEAGVPADILEAARRDWDEALEYGLSHGYRNAQVSVLAPTGTIGFLMDCDTTGIEPDIALVKYKWLVGGGLMKIVNQTVAEALDRLGCSVEQISDILAYLEKNETIEGAPHLKEEDLPVFDCAFRPANGKRSIAFGGHIRMMAAVQPFLSGAISKTVNLPSDATVEDIERTFIDAWRLGLKAVAVYRDGSKGQQAVTTSKTAEKKTDTARHETPDTRSDAVVAEEAAARIEYRPMRRRLPEERQSITHKFSVAGHEGYITVGRYDDGTPGEMFLRMSKGGSVVSGLMDAFATAVSIALQYGVPLKVLVNKFVHVRFEPSGFTGHPNIRIAKSIVDYLFRWLALKFLSPEEQRTVGVNIEVETVGGVAEADVDSSLDVQTAAAQESAQAEAAGAVSAGSAAAKQMSLTDADGRLAGADVLTRGFDTQSDAPTCHTCGAMMVRNGACYKCLNCGATSGCS